MRHPSAVQTLEHSQTETGLPQGQNNKTQSNSVSAIQCQEGCNELYIGENKQPIHKRMAQTCHLLWTRYSSTPERKWTLLWRQPGERELTWLERDRWYEKDVKEAIHGKLKKSPLNRGSVLRHFLSPTYSAVLHSLGQNSKHSHCLTRPNDSQTDKGDGSQEKRGQWLCQRPCQRFSGDHYRVICTQMVPRAILSGSAPSLL